MEGQTPWLAIALAFLAPSGIGAGVVMWLLTRRVEGVKAEATLSTAVYEGWDKLIQRNEEALARQDREIEELKAENAELRAQLEQRKRGPRA